jgi:hypothetical protein
MFSMIYKALGYHSAIGPDKLPLHIAWLSSSLPAHHSGFLCPEGSYFLDRWVLTFLNFIWANNLLRAN